MEKKTVPEYLAELDYDFKNYIPSKSSVKFINFIKLVNYSKGGEENKSPVVHMKMLDSVFNAQKRTAIMCHRGIAKALSLDSKLYTDNGIITIKDCKVGDKIIGENGQFTTITHKSEIFNKKMYKITLEDGRSIKVSEDHINTVIHRRRVALSPKKGTTIIERRDLTTKDLLKYALTSPRGATKRNPKGYENNFWIPLPEPAQYSEKQLKKDPYEYGVELSKRTEDNPIPNQYLFSSFNQRLELLKGYMDNKGIITNKGSVSFKCEYELLKESLMTLIYSLGGIAKKSGFNVNIQININLFKEESKARNFKDNSKNKIAIERIEEIEIEPSQCISVDNESKTFLTDNYIVTHNTTLMAEYMFLYIATFGKLDGFGKIDLAIYVSDSIENGVKNLRRNIEYRYEESEFLKDHIPYIRFTDTRLEFRNKEGHVFIVKMYGAKTGVRGSKEKGMRPQLAVLDDLVSDEDARSQTIISTIEDTVHKAVSKALHPTRSKTIWLGTPFNQGDPLYKAVESGAWNVSVYPVAESFDEFTKPDNFKSAWPDRFTYEYVKDEYESAKKQGKLDGFFQELMLEVISDEERVIKDEDIIPYDYMKIKDNIDEMNIYITTDFATSEKGSADYSAISVWGVNNNDNWIWLDGICSRQLMNKNIDQLFKFVQIYKPMSVGVEVSGQQGGFIQWIKNEMMNRRIYFNLASANNTNKEGIRPRKNKLERMLEVQPRFKQKKIWLPENHRKEVINEMKQELKGITMTGIKSKHDDLLDTISMMNEMPIVVPSVEQTLRYDSIHEEWITDDYDNNNNSYIID